MTDAEAILASHTRAAAFEAVFVRHFDAIHRYLARRVGTDLADELAAEAFAVAFRKRRRYDATRADARSTGWRPAFRASTWSTGHATPRGDWA